MELPILILSFIFGTVIGSFLNVVIARYDTGMTLKGRSKCFSCNKTLLWYELVPILSFLVQKAACRRCKSKISWQYPIVEFGTGVIFALIAWYFPPATLSSGFMTIFLFLITSILVVITVYDAKHKIIPDPLVYTFAALAFLRIFISPDLSFVVSTIWQILAGPLLALPFFLLWLISRGTWMGLGDAKLALGIGWTLGVAKGISAIVLAFWIGAIISVIWMIIVLRKFKTKYEIPFGPYLILGMYIVLFWKIQVFDFEVLYEILSI